MTIAARTLAALAAIAVAAAACGGDPPATPSPMAAASPSPTPRPAPTELAFAPAALPATGSACELEGYRGHLGRIEAVDARTVVFTLCGPDAAFPARLAHPALGILDATTIARLGAGEDVRRTAAGAGPYVIERWNEGDNVELRRFGEAVPVATAPVVVLRWDASAAARTRALEDAAVDAIDAPGPAELDSIATLPELAVTPRTALATAFLAFGSGPAFAGAGARRAIAGAIDRAALVAGSFPLGSTVPTHVAPCVLAEACEGRGWYEFNAPAAVAALQAAGFDLERTYPLHVPDVAVPGLPDPAGVAEAIRAQLAANVGVTVEVDPMPLDEFRERVSAGSLDGLYLDGVETPLADATGILEPLFGAGVRTTPARRARDAASEVAAVRAAAPGGGRAAAIERANEAIRSSAVVVPLAHPGATIASRTDVTGLSTSPLGADPLGAAVPGDRPQLVFTQAAEPAGAWCGDQSSADAFRLCGLVGAGLYGFAPDGLVPEPALARCQPSDDAATWTCTLQPDRTFSDGMRVDAGDVLATIGAAWDASSPLRARPDAGDFGAVDALLGGPFDPGG